jgi:D-alanine transaminase
VTRQADQAILRGVTRATLLDLAARNGFSFEERPFSREEAYRAREAFFSSATTIAMPVVAIDGRRIGDGRPGPLTLALRRAFRESAQRS